MSRIDECDLWWFREVYSVLAAFADDPDATTARFEGVSVPEDQAEHLHDFRESILGKYPDAARLAVMGVVAEIEAILDGRSFGGEAFDEDFWTNDGFQRPPDWQAIRGRTRAFLLR